MCCASPSTIPVTRIPRHRHRLRVGALVSGRSRTFGLMVSEITRPFFPEVVQTFINLGVEHNCSRSGRAFTCTSPPTYGSWLNLVERWVVGGIRVSKGRTRAWGSGTWFASALPRTLKKGISSPAPHQRSLPLASPPGPYYVGQGFLSPPA
jgi:hypothetical protein